MRIQRRLQQPKCMNMPTSECVSLATSCDFVGGVLIEFAASIDPKAYFAVMRARLEVPGTAIKLAASGDVALLCEALWQYGRFPK